LSGVLLDPLEGGLGCRGVKGGLSSGHAGQRPQLLLIVLHQGLALSDGVTLLGQHSQPTEHQHTGCDYGGPAHEEHPFV
jgi:hypothetical protein